MTDPSARARSCVAGCSSRGRRLSLLSLLALTYRGLHRLQVLKS
jgi:hypothetical protein